jgi:hypothetical protein
LEKFAGISGLHCNFDKTALLPVHPPTTEELAWIREAGFSIVDKIKLLGADITADAADNCNNFDNILEKIIQKVQFWSRFKLSFTGRICIAKTFLMSQLTYLGCIFRPTAEQLRLIQQCINNFIRKNLKISDARIYLPPSKGEQVFLI